MYFQFTERRISFAYFVKEALREAFEEYFVNSALVTFQNHLFFIFCYTHQVPSVNQQNIKFKIVTWIINFVGAQFLLGILE